MAAAVLLSTNYSVTLYMPLDLHGDTIQGTGVVIVTLYMALDIHGDTIQGTGVVM